EQGLPLAGATIEVKGGAQRTSTDNDGAFTLAAPPGAVLLVSYIGHVQQEIAVGERTLIDVTLQPSANDLDEVIVVGYTAQRRTNITGAVGTVSMADAQKRRVPDVSQMLQGQVAGVQVTQATGAPGDPIDIRIRGVGTIGNNSPLFIVDGVPSTNFSF